MRVLKEIFVRVVMAVIMFCIGTLLVGCGIHLLNHLPEGNIFISVASFVGGLFLAVAGVVSFLSLIPISIEWGTFITDKED